MTCRLVFRALLLALLLTSPAHAKGAAPAPKQEIWYHSGYGGGVTGPSSGMSARMGPTKMPVVFEAIRAQALVPPSQLHVDGVRGAGAPAPAIDLASLRAVHSDRYLKAILTGEPKALACSQGLPSWSAGIARGWLLNLGGLYAAASAALAKKTITANLGHGYHHAGVNRGEGYCTLNGLAVVARKLLAEGKARRVMVVDLDQHEGNGTAACTIGAPGIINVSIYGSNMGGPPAAENNLVVHVKHGSLTSGQARDANYLAAIASRLPALIRQHDPDLILYQAGMDPHDCAGITPEALAVRDAYVFAVARSLGKPVTWVLAGGYSSLEMLRRLHTGTVKAANDVLARVRVGDRVEPTGSLGARPYSWSAGGGKVSFPDWSAMVAAQGGAKLELPASMTREQTRSFVVERERLLSRERLPESDLQTAYRALLSGR
jgi:acetoin utilization deacetylase AcuC-like enzyme